MKHTLCDLQEKIFHLQIQLLEEDIAGGKKEPLFFFFNFLSFVLQPTQSHEVVSHRRLLECSGRAERMLA